MKRIIAIITVGAATALMQVDAQETKTTEKETYPEAQEEVIGERAQPSADYQHNQYGTYPQGIDSTVLAQTRIEIRKSDLPEEVQTSFENSKYSDREIVAIYEVIHSPESDTQAASEESTSDPTYHNELNERSRMESMNSAEEQDLEHSNEEVVPLSETETTLNQSEEEGNSIEHRSSDTEIATTNTFSELESALVKYEIEVKEKGNQTTLIYTEKGELEETSSGAQM